MIAGSFFSAVIVASFGIIAFVDLRETPRREIARRVGFVAQRSDAPAVMTIA